MVNASAEVGDQLHVWASRSDDLSVDPGEKQNIADKSPELIAMFRRELKERRRQRLDMDIGQAQLNEDTIEVLRALGYVR